MPQDIPSLLNYFDETLWFYSTPTIHDDTELVTKDEKIFSALKVIFPRKLKSYRLGENIEVDIKPNYPEENGLTSMLIESDLIRFASSYEVEQINALIQEQKINSAFQLTEDCKTELKKNRFELVIAYQVGKLLAENISLLLNEVEILKLQVEIYGRQNNFKQINEEITLSRITTLKFMYPNLFS